MFPLRFLFPGPPEVEMKIFHDAHNFDRYFWGQSKKLRSTGEAMAPELDLPEYWAAAIPMKCLAAWLPEKPRPKPKSIPLLLLQLKDKSIFIFTLRSVDAKKALLLLGMPWAKSGEYSVQGQLAMTTSSFGHYFLQIWIWRVLSIIIHAFVFEIVGIIDFLVINDGKIDPEGKLLQSTPNGEATKVWLKKFCLEKLQVIALSWDISNKESRKRASLLALIIRWDGGITSSAP